VRRADAESVRVAGDARHTSEVAGVAKPAQPLDEHRVVLLRLGGVDEPAEQLVVPRRRHPEICADGLFLGPDVAPPLPFEAKDVAVAVAEGHGPTLDREVPTARAPLHEPAERIDRRERHAVPAEDEAAPLPRIDG